MGALVLRSVVPAEGIDRSALALCRIEKEEGVALNAEGVSLVWSFAVIISIVGGACTIAVYDYCWCRTLSAALGVALRVGVSGLLRCIPRDEKLWNIGGRGRL